jgi:hypothetical protein
MHFRIAGVITTMTGSVLRSSGGFALFERRFGFSIVINPWSLLPSSLNLLITL